MSRMNHRVFHLAIYILIIISAAADVFSQTKGLTGLDSKEVFQKDVDSKQMTDMFTKGDQMPAGNIVDPLYYFVGPGDILSLVSNPSIPIEQSLLVTPECSLIIPRIGEISLKGMTLAQAKKAISDSIHARNPISITSLTLRQARMCLITIRGNVVSPGSYALPASYRVSTALMIANQLRAHNSTASTQLPALLQLQERQRDYEKMYSESGIPYTVSYSSRNIFLIRKDGTSSQVDFEMANATSNSKYDPFIREGDEILVPFEPDNYPTISITGAVQRPVSIPYKNGDKTSLLLKLSGGLVANAEESDISLFQPGSEKINLKIDSAMNPIGTDHELMPGSIVMVGRKPDIKKSNVGVVSVRGQVKNAGVFMVKNGETKLREIIEQAGGFTSDACLPLAKIYRRGSTQVQTIDSRRELSEYFQYSNLTLEDTVRYNIDMMLKRPFVSCDFVSVFTQGSEKDNVPLHDGDVIDIPASPGKVFVWGQVNQPGYIEYVSGKNMEWYIERAGGYADRAEESRARIIRGGSKVWIEGEPEIMVYDGDEIYIPRPADIPPGIELQKYSVLTGALATLISVIAVVYNIFKP